MKYKKLFMVMSLIIYASLPDSLLNELIHNFLSLPSLSWQYSSSLPILELSTTLLYSIVDSLVW